MRLDRVDFSYSSGGQRTQIFSALSRAFSPDKIHAVIGSSGCGKTTLLYLLSGLLTPEQGHISFESPNRPAIILQDFGLFPWKRVKDNVALGLKLRGESRLEISAKSESIMEELGISDLASSYPADISGGERQRVAIARAMVLEPEVLLMDEPFSSLDAMNREKMQDLLLKLHRKHNMTVLLVTHSIEEAAFLSSTIHVMKKADTAYFLPEIEGLTRGMDRRSPQFHQTVDIVRSQLGEL